MKLKINKNKLQDNPVRILRKFGYGFIRDRQSGSDSLVRRLGNDFYPRFHIYIKEDQDLIVFDLHLDHKQSTIAGSSRHNSEYQGELVERELENLRQFIESLAVPSSKNEESRYSEEKISWWSKLLGG